ncbi:hypothetical protein EC991_011220 [Linnemannia zychae]|nr:hypothetical protein EC991_011220 [Linnemannia zychae]
MQGSFERYLRQNNSSSRRVLQSLRDAQATPGNRHPDPRRRQQNFQAIESHLRSCIVEKRLQDFYPLNDPSINSRFNNVLRRVLQTNFHETIALSWAGVNAQLAERLCKLALYDIILLIDDSSSIRKSNHIDGRLEDLEFLVSTIAEVAALFDDDGIYIEFLNSGGSYRGVKEGGTVKRILRETEFLGNTKLGGALKQKIHRRFFREAATNRTRLRMRKPVLVFVITDGEPYGEPLNALEDQIRSGSQFLYQHGYPVDFISYQIAQVGNDPRSSEFLHRLDVNRDLGKFIDVTSRLRIEIEQLRRLGYNPTPETYLVKLLLGAIDRRFDKMDEQRR